VTGSRLHYQSLASSDESGRLVNVTAYHVPEAGGLRAVLYSRRHHAWIFAPDLVVRFLYDDLESDRARPVDRPAAEQIARDVLHVELPDEPEILALMEEGAQQGWTFGPPAPTS
jgi:hypothetical protein